MTAKQRAQGALSRALDETATPGRRTIIDALAGDSVCRCGRDGAKPRTWQAPAKDNRGRWQAPVDKYKRPIPNMRGYTCDDCEVALDVARRHLKAGLVTKAGQALERVAS